jgi:hypothetical protein
MTQEPSEQENLALARQVLAKAIEINELQDVTEEIRLRLMALAANNKKKGQKIITRLGHSNNRSSSTVNRPPTNLPFLAKYAIDEGTCLYLRYFTEEGFLVAEVFYDPIEEVLQLLNSTREWIKFYHENVYPLSQEDYDKAVFTNAYDKTAFMLLKVHQRLQLATQHLVDETILIGMTESEKLAKRAWRAQGRKVDGRKNFKPSKLFKDEAAHIKRLMFNRSRAGNEGKWSPEFRAILLSKYDEALSTAQEARKEFKKAMGKNNTDWFNKVKDKYPSLDDMAIQDLNLYKSNSDIALDYAVRFAEREFNIIQSAEHIRTEVLKLARREAKEKK